MKPKMLLLLIVAILLALTVSALAVEMVKTKPLPANPAYLTGDETIPNATYHPSTPGVICDSPGEIMGWTQYDYQSNGSTGRRVVVDPAGGLHFAWMCGDPFPSIRNIKYNCFTPTSPSQWPEEGLTISYRNGAGYCQIGVLADGRAAVAFHQAPTNAESLFCAIDQFQCLGAFDMRHPPSRLGTNKTIWPYITVDRTGRIHLVATTTTSDLSYTYEPVGYTRSNNGGTTWVAMTAVDTTRAISTIVVSSKVSDKVAIVYCHPYDTTAGRANVYYVESADGITWNNFTPKVNVTNYHRNNDSLYAWSEVSALYDFNDNLHIVWPGIYVAGAPNSSPSFYYGRSHVYHWDATSNSIHYFADFDSTWPSAGCDMASGGFVHARVSVAIDSLNHLFVAYTSWDTSDCSLTGFANGDIYLQSSYDNGVTWSPKVNMTSSPTPLCAAGDCDADNWSSLAEVTTTGGMLHLLYINDKDAGGVVNSEGSATDNPVRHIEYPTTAVGDDIKQPKDFSLAQNYPNPFNSKTNLDFSLDKPSRVTLTIYDVTGALVATLTQGEMPAGAHSVTWNADGVSSGVYYYRLATNTGSQVKKMILLK
jgi:hypothetical protein